MAKFKLSAFADEASEGLDGQINALLRNGISYIEPRNIDGISVIKMSDAQLYEVRRRLDAAGIKVYSLGSPIGKYSIKEDFAPHLSDFRRALEVCKILGTSRMRMFSFYVKQKELARYRSEVMRRLSIMTEEAQAAGITLCHENEGEIYGQNPQEVEDLLENIPALGGIFDPANYVYYGGNPVKGFEATLPHLTYMHIKDCIGESRVIVPAGMGDGHIEEILTEINKRFDEEFVLTVEPHLYESDSYKKFDGKRLYGMQNFSSADEAFDAAVNALKELLVKIQK